MDNSKKIDRVEMLSGKELVKQSLRDMEDAYCLKRSAYSIPTFSNGLNSLILGLKKSDVIVIAGRPGTGKSAFVHNIISGVALQQVPVLLCSPEMLKEVVFLRLFSMKSNVDCKAMQSGDLTVVDWPRLVTAAGCLSESILNIDDTLPLPVSRIFQIANELKTDNKLELLIVDSLQFVVPDDDKSENAAGSIMLALKHLARELNIPVLLTLPMKAELPESRERYPCLNDVGNEQIVNYADVIILLQKVMSLNKEKTKVDALVAKNRNGELGIVPFHFFYQYLRFEECSPQEQTALKMH